MDILTLKSEAEADNFLDLLTLHADVLATYIQVGAITPTAGTKTEWFWASSGDKINFPLKWYYDEPNNINDDEFCLNLIKDGNNRYWFNDENCWKHLQNFVCQREDIF